MGIFITFEGIDGCGKSTQMKFLAEYIAEKGGECITTREPGGCGLSEQIREMLLDVENTSMDMYTEALLYAAARVQHINEVIRPALEAGKVVLCDRYIDSSVAYQGYGRGLGRDTVLAINRYAVENCMPDVTFFFDCPPEWAKLRMHRRTEKDRLEQEDEDFFMRVYEGFCEEIPRSGGRIQKMDVSGTKYETRERLRAVYDGIIARRK